MTKPARFELENKVVIITGASAGIGRALARQAATEGAKLMLSARRENLLLELKRECQELGSPEVEILAVDIGSRSACQSLVNTTLERFGRIDVLINNAGYAVSGNLLELADISLFESVMNVNFMAAVWLTHSSLPHLVKTGGAICGISSVAGLFSKAGSSSYNASKFAMKGFFDSLRQEVQSEGVSVTMIYPGYVVTEFASRVQDTSGKERGKQALKFYKPHMMSAERCAKITFRAIKKRKREVVMTFMVNLARWVAIPFPGLIDFVLGMKNKRDTKASK